MWILLGVFVLLGGQPSEAGTGDHAQTGSQVTPRALAYDQYVAIGDSYTSGAGVPPGDLSGCMRSGRNYPNRLAERLDAQLTDDSCGGAWTTNVEQPQGTSAGTNPPQLAALGRRTDLVTVSLGINDAGFSAILERCTELALLDPQGSPCRASYQGPDGDALLSRLIVVGQSLERELGLVRQGAPRAQVVVVGYPQLVPEVGTCPDMPFATGDYAYFAEFLTDLDAIMRAAAHRAGVRFVSLLGPSRGHDVCAGDEAWVLGARPSPRTTVWHPFANEQRAVAGLVADALEHDRRHPAAH
jgi:lysophospholipase L1-like esterase